MVMGMPTGLYVNAGQGGGALFDSLAPGAVVENFTVDGSVEAQSGTGWGADMRAAGAVKNAFGKADKRITIRNVGNYADVAARSSADRAGGYAGGILSIGYHVDIVGCFNEGDILTGHYGGGIFGYGSEWLNYSYMNIADCYNVGDVRATFGGSSSTNWGYAGGIAGYGAALENCYNAGDAVNDSGQAYGVNLGSIAGYSFKVTDCYAVEDADCIVDQGAGLSIVSLEEMQAPDFSTKLGDSFGYTEGSTPTLVWQGLSGKPSIVAQPVDVQCLVGEKATLSLDAALPADGEVGADGALSYQWYSVTDKSYEGAVAIEAATSSSYEASTADPFTGYVFCVVTNTFGGKASFAYSDIVLLDVASTLAATPEITVTESREGVYGGDPIEDLAVTVTNSAAQGMSPILKYQWYTSDQNDFGTAEVIEGATDATYAAPELVGANYYWCEVTNDYTANSSASALGGPAVVTISAEDVHIKTAEDLVALQQNVEGGADYKGVKVYVDANIDLSSVCSAETQSWKPIGSASAPFRGAFDGGYHVISNLYASADSENAGLFGYVGEGAVVENLAVEGSVTKSGWNSYASGIVAYASGTEVEPVVLRNLRNEADVNSSNGWNGGVVAYASYVDIIRCGNLGTMSGSGVLHGGIAADAIQTRIVDCYNAGDLTNDNNYSQTGGIVGRMDGRGRSELSNLVNVGRLSCGSDSANTIAGSTIYGTPKGDKATWFALSGTFPGKYVSWDDAQTYYVSASWLASDKAVSALGSAWVKGESHPVLSWEGILVGSPDITEHPVGGEYAIGSTVSLSVAASLPEGVDTSGVLSYQWQKSADGIVFEDIEDATAATLTIDTASASALYYRCVVSNTWGAGEDVSSASAVSQAAGVVILSGKAAGKPSITVQPAENIEASFGAEAEALVVAADVVEDDEAAKGTLFYQWYVSDVNDFAKAVPVEGAVAASYVPATCFSGVKYYWCEIANVYELAKESSVVSDSAKVTVDGSYSIVTADDLWALQDLAKDGATFENVRIALNGDIDMGASAEKPWESLPVFSGIFDGGEYVISGYYSTTGGMFGTLTGSASVMNLTLRGEINAPEAEYVAGIANEAEYVDDTHQVTITNVCSDVDVNAANYAAGILSRCMSSSIDATAAIKGCVNKGDITVSPAGSSTAPVAAGIIDSCVNEGDVVVGGAHSVASQLAGIVSSCGAPSNCLNVGKVGDAQSSTDAPIYCSARRDPAVSTNNYYLDSTGTAMTQDGATAKTDEELKAAGMAAQISSEFVDVAASYPQLAWLVETGAPVITTQPEGAFYVTGTDKAADLVVVAELPTAPYAGHDGTLSYQWQKSSDKVAFADIEGATNASFALTGFGDVGTTYYRCVVANTYGSGLVKTVESDIVAIVVNDTEAAAPVISEQPKDVEGAMSEGVEFSVTAGFPENAAEGSTGEISYQWYACDDAEGSNPVAIEGATDSTFKIETDVETGLYDYWCRVTNTWADGSKSVDSNAVTVRVVSTLEPVEPYIISQPTTVYYELGATLDSGAIPMSIVVDQDEELIGELSYQWYAAKTIESYRNATGTLLEGATDSEYMPYTGKIGTVYYYCIVTNTFEGIKTASTKSNVVKARTWSVEAAAPVVSGQPSEKAIYFLGDEAAALEVVAAKPVAPADVVGGLADRTAHLSYQWYETATGLADPTADAAVDGATGSTFVPSTNSEVGLYHYYCVVTNNFETTYPASSQTSSVVSEVSDVYLKSRIEVATPELDSFGMADASYVQGQGASPLYVDVLNAGVEGMGSLSYQWQQEIGGVWTDIEEATDYSYTPSTSVNAGDYRYRCVVLNTFELVKEASAVSEVSTVSVRPVVIESVSDLLAFCDNVNAGADYAGLTVELANDIDLSGEDWVPIGAFSPFAGTFDGKGHKIAGLYYEGAPSTPVGLFGYLGCAVVKNLEVEGSITVTGGDSQPFNAYVGGLAGYQTDGLVLENVGVDVDIYVDDAAATWDYIGGLIGCATSVSNSVSCRLSMDSCYVKGSVTESSAGGSVSGLIYAGGFVGSAAYGNAASVVSLTDCYNMAEVAVDGAYVGGFFGQSNRSVVFDGCYNAGTVSVSASAEPTAEAFVSVGSTPTFSNCYYLEGSADYVYYNGVGYDGVAVKADADMKAASFAATMGSGYKVGDIYPVLKWEVDAGMPVISKQPASIVVLKGSSDTSLFVVAGLPAGDGAAAGGELSYQWYQNTAASSEGAVAIEGATGSTLVPSADEPGVTYYYCVVTNTYSGGKRSCESSYAVVTVVSDTPVAVPTVSEQPVGAEYARGDRAAALAVSAAVTGEGAGELSYQWYKGSSDSFTSATAIGGATSATYLPSTSDVGYDYYWCVVTNTFEGVRVATAMSDCAVVHVKGDLQVSTPEQLVKLRDEVNAGVTYQGVAVELLNDIDLGTLGENWSGIGTNSNVNCFRGTFEGNGHVVDLGDAASSGLFRFVNGATVRNFVVKGTVSTGGSNVGGAVGYAAGTSASPTLVENIGNEASVSGGTYTGGVVGGGGSYVTVRGCYNKGAVATSGSIGYAGGLVGYLNDRCVVENCYNAFSMKSDVAAIIGRINNSTKGTIRNCFDAGSNSKMAGAYNIENAARKCYSLTVGSNAFTKITEAAMSDPEFAATLGSAFKVGDTHPALIWERTPFGAPVITVQPAAAGCMVGYDAPALVVVAEGPAGDKEPTQGNTLTYQWYETETGVADPANDALIEGATESSYAPANHPMGKRMFYCVVTNTWDGGSASITSDVAVYSVTDRTPAAVPVLTGQPEGDKTYQQRGVAAQLSVSAEVSDEGAGELSYAWYRNMTGVADPAVDELVGEERVFTPSTTEELGTSFYYCVVTNTYEGAKRASTTSNLAAITLTPIEISTGQQLASFVSAGIVDYNKAETVNNLVGVLTADITLTNLIAFGSGGRWASDYFCATLDGQGHTIDISNVWPSNGVYQAGLFGAVGPGAVLENFVVTGSVLSNNYGYFDAGVACWANGAADNPVTIRNVGNEATVSGSQGRCVAGVVAYANNCVIDSCYNKGTVDVPTYNGGGVVNTAYNSVITNCYNAGNVTVAKVFNDASYGAAGVVASADPTTVVKNCYNVGTVVMSSAEQSDIDATGAVVGNMRDGATASNNYYLEGSYAFDRSGAEPMASEAMKTEVFVGELNADGSFFEYVEGSYPALAWEGRHYLGEEGFSIEPIVDVVYNGSAIEPEVVVSAGEGEAKLVLVEGEDYEVSYYANSFVGTAYVKVTGIGSYDGTLETSFGILPLSLDAAEFETIPDLFYTGSELKPAVSIKAGGSLLVEGKDYTVSYFDTYDYPMTVLEPGTYYAVATGIGMVSGSKTSDTFEVVGYDPISELQITGPADVTYNGTEQKPQVTVYDESKDRTLEEGVDYELAFTDNLNAGTASVEISGLGVYEGVVTKTFEIGKASLTVEAKDASKAVGEKDPALLADADGLVGSDVLSGYQIVRADGEDAGKYAITPSDAVIMRGDVEASSNYEIDYVAAEFAIVGGWNRLFGYDYTDTMQAITSAGFADGSCKAVIVATSTGYWDALGASGLAGLLDAPVLLTGKSGLPEQTAAEIKRLAHEDGMTVYIAGGPGVISSEIETEIESIVGVIGVERAYGETMLDTALEIYRAGGDQWGTTAIVATAGGFQDALSIAPYSYAYDAPIFLTSGSTKVLTDEAVQAIKDGGFERVIIVGGPGVIKSDVEGQLDGIKTERLYGETAYDTSGAVANWCLTQGMSVDKMGVATGANYLDALAGASFCGKNNAVLVLVHDDYRTCLDMVVAANAADICQGYVFGGESVVSAETFELLSAALEG